MSHTAPSSIKLRRVTVIVPTYREAANIPLLIERISKVREAHGLDLDVLVMDDDSRDGTVEAVAALGASWVRLVVRTQDRGLSAAVLDGMRRAEGDVLVCMDADLSHPPEVLPTMLRKLEEGADFVIGSRYVEGGSTSDDWGFLRWLNSRVATLLALPLTSARDPMAGYFALERRTFERGEAFNPVGYKIGLELLVKCRCERVVETPIHFEDRRLGESKLTFWQQLLYLQHLRRLYVFKFGVWSQVVQFLAVGALGTLVNLGVLTGLLAMGGTLQPSVAVAILVSMTFNFLLNRRFSFGHAQRAGIGRQFVGYMAACSVGAGINYALTLMVTAQFPGLAPQVAALAGITVATGFNFAASRYLVFRATRIRPVADTAAVADPVAAAALPKQAEE